MEEHVSVKQSSMLDEVLAGLQKPQKQLPSKFFYDERGSQLFEQITHLQEYYPTRTEKKILKSNITDISKRIGSHAMLIELGSGSSRKTRLLLDHLTSLAAYLPVDISEQYLLKVVNAVRRDYPRLSISPDIADYTSSFELPNLGGGYNKQVVFFPGSTIGNFSPDFAKDFLQTMAQLTDDDAGMLIGVDLKKDKTVLEAAYNDEQGVTAQFNKNILVRLNRELDANFNVDSFEHRAFFNEEGSRIEMHLVSAQEQQVTIAGQHVGFEEGESIHTENSYKYTQADFAALVSDWFTVEQVWTDDQDYFSLQYLTKK